MKRSILFHFITSCILAVAVAVPGQSRVVIGENRPKSYVPLVSDQGRAALAVTEASEQSAKSRNAIIYPTDPDETLPDPFDTVPEAPSDPAVTPEPSVVVDGRSSLYIRGFSDVKIRIVDEGRNLSAADRKQLFRFLDGIPLKHLKGLGEIRLGASESTDPWQTIADAARAIGRHVYAEFMTEDERAAWQTHRSPRPEMEGVDLAEDFADWYAKFVIHSDSLLEYALGYSPNPQTPGNITHDTLPPFMVLSSLFFNSEKGALGWFTWQEDHVRRGATATQMSRRTLQMGDHYFVIERGDLRGYRQFNAAGEEVGSARWDELVTLPETVRLRLR